MGEKMLSGAIAGAVASAFWGTPAAIRSQVEALLPADMKTSLAAICETLHDHAGKDELM